MDSLFAQGIQRVHVLEFLDEQVDRVSRESERSGDPLGRVVLEKVEKSTDGEDRVLGKCRV
jgi:hypothetical protein